LTLSHGFSSTIGLVNRLINPLEAFGQDKIISSEVTSSIRSSLYF
jgi:hypothetical protein